MNPGAVAAGTIAVAAAAEQQRRRDEEEEMSGYSPEELADGWEFKILRSNTGAFKNSEKLRATLDAEARAGWSLVEKFDNGRIRLKRPASARARDHLLDFDPYRTDLGPTEMTFILWILLGTVVGTIAVIALLVAILG